MDPEVDPYLGTVRLQLLDACSNGDFKAVQELVERSGTEVDFLGEGHETTPLHNACENCHLDIAILLLDNGAKLDRAKVHGETLLSFACSQQREEGHLEVARLLLDRGAGVDKAASGGVTPLCCACENGHLEMARLLLNKGAEVDKAEDHEFTPLRLACQEGYLEVARLLLDRGADVDKADHRGRTPLFYPCVKGHLQVVKLLLMGGASAVVKADPARPFQADANALLKQWRTTPPARWEAVHRQGCWEYVDAPYGWTPENHAQYPTAFRASVQARISALGILVAMQGPLATFKEAPGPLAEMIATGLHREMGLHRGASAEFSAPS